MPEQRHAYKVGHSVVVAIPATVQEHVGVELGAPLYWFTTRRGEVVLTSRAKRIGGHPEGLALQRQLDAARAEIERLRRRLAGRDQAVLHEGKSVGWAEASKYYSKLEGDIAGLAAAVRELSARVPFRRRSRRRDAPPAEGPPPPPRPVDEIPLPDLPSAPELAGGDVASGGAAPPGHPQEI